MGGVVTIGTYEEAWNGVGWIWDVIGAEVTIGGYEVGVKRGEGGAL